MKISVHLLHILLPPTSNWTHKISKIAIKGKLHALLAAIISFYDFSPFQQHKKTNFFCCLLLGTARKTTVVRRKKVKLFFFPFFSCFNKQVMLYIFFCLVGNPRSKAQAVYCQRWMSEAKMFLQIRHEFPLSSFCWRDEILQLDFKEIARVQNT